MAPRELVDDHEADVVPVTRVLATGVAEPDDEQIQRRGRFASTEERQGLLLFCGRAVVGLGGSGGLAAAASAASPASSAASSASVSPRGLEQFAMTVSADRRGT